MIPAYFSACKSKEKIKIFRFKSHSLSHIIYTLSSKNQFALNDYATISQPIFKHRYSKKYRKEICNASLA